MTADWNRGQRRRRTAPVVALAAGVAASLVLAACSSSPSGSNNQSGIGGASAAGSAPAGIAGDTLTIQATEPTSLNPALGPLGQAGALFTYLSYASLIYQKQDGSYVPDLAARWGYVGKGNKEFSITLRNGLKFADGTPLDAQAVVNSFKYFKDAGGPQEQYLATLTSATATDATTVDLKFSAPMPNLDLLLSQSQGLGAIMSAAGIADPDAMASKSFGAGPYTIKSSDVIEGSQYTYTANPNYWNQDAIHYKKIVVKVVPDPNAIVSGMQDGSFDAALRMESYAGSQAATSAGLNVTPSAYGIWTLILADRNGEVAPALKDVRVRQAINYALDRDTLAKLAGGDGAITTNQLSIPDAPGYDDAKAKTYAYDPAKAKSLLAEAGVSGLELPVLENQVQDPDSLIGQEIESELAAVGIKVKLKVVPSPKEMLPEALTKKYPVMLYATPFFGPGYFFASKNAISTYENPFGTKDPSLDGLYATAGAQDPAAQAETFKKISDFFVDQAWFAPFAAASRYFVVSDKVAGVQKPTSGLPGILNPVGPDADLSWYPAD